MGAKENLRKAAEKDFLRNTHAALMRRDKFNPILIPDYTDGLQIAIKKMVERIGSGEYEYVRLVISNHWASEGYWIEFKEEPIKNIIDDRIVAEWRIGQDMPNGANLLLAGRKIITDLTGKKRFE